MVTSQEFHVHFVKACLYEYTKNIYMNTYWNFTFFDLVELWTSTWSLSLFNKAKLNKYNLTHTSTVLNVETMKAKRATGWCRGNFSRDKSSFPNPLVPQLRVMGVPWSLSQWSWGEGRWTPWTINAGTHRGKQPLAPTDNLDFPVDIAGRFLDWVLEKWVESPVWARCAAGASQVSLSTGS